MKRVFSGMLLLLVIIGVGVATYAISGQSTPQQVSIAQPTSSTEPILAMASKGVLKDKDVIDCQKLKFVDHVNDDSINAILDKVTFCLDGNQATRLMLTSDGGFTQSAHGFFDSVMNHKNRKLLTTIAVGNVDSAGVTMYLAGEERLITPSTTMLIHLTTSRLDGRFDYIELEAEMNHLKLLQDIQFRITAERSRMSLSQVREAMIESKNYDAEEAVKLGLATAILEHQGS